jgi:hypothetical protein
MTEKIYIHTHTQQTIIMMMIKEPYKVSKIIQLEENKIHFLLYTGTERRKNKIKIVKYGTVIGRSS